MKIEFNVTGTERKALVTAVSEITGWNPVYKGAPTFAFAVNDIVIDKNGTLTGEVKQELLDALAEKGFIAPNSNMEVSADAPASAEQAETPDTLSIELPKNGFTEINVDNLRKLVQSKAALIQKAIGTDSLPIEETEERLRFPWFPTGTSADEVNAYTHFISALCAMVKEQKRVTAKPKEVANEKYAFRCFLLRLGFIGEEYAAARKILLAKLSGNGSFKSGERKKDAEDTDSDDALPAADYNSLAEMIADAELIHAVNASFDQDAGEEESR